MTETQSGKRYDLEERTLAFARNVSLFVKRLPKTLQNIEYSKQLVRATGSVGANYIEANEALSRRDFVMRVKISRKESKESRYWLQLVECQECDNSERATLIGEATELMKIFGAIVQKTEK